MGFGPRGWKIALVWVVLGLACSEGPTTPSQKQYTPVDSLSPGVPTLHVNPADPAIVTVPASDGEALQYLADKDALGNPVGLRGLRKIDLHHPTAFDLVIFGSNKLPSQVSLRDGGRVFFEYTQDGHVAITVIASNGQSASASMALRASAKSKALLLRGEIPGQPLAGRAALRQRPSLASASGPGIAVSVHVTSGSNAPPPPVNVAGTWSTAASVPVMFLANLLPDGTYGAILPVTNSPLTTLVTALEPLCEEFSSTVESTCQAIEASGLDKLLANPATCLPFLKLPEVFLACETAVLLVEYTCDTISLSTFCDLLQDYIDLHLDPRNTLTISVTVSGHTCQDGKVEVIEPPIPQQLNFAFTCPAEVGSVTVTPPTASVDVGQAAQLNAALYDAVGNVLTGRLVFWSSSDYGVASVSQTGAVAGVGPGSATITATSEGKSGTATITVNSIATITVAPATDAVLVGDSLQLVPTFKDEAGNVVTGLVFAWASSEPAVATVSAEGVVTGVATGTATITATSEGRSGTAVIIVTDFAATSYCGTFAGTNDVGNPENGSFTLTVDPTTGSVSGVVQATDGQPTTVTGTVSGGNVTFGGPEGTIATGTITATTVEGTYTGAGMSQGTFTGTNC